jgi:ERCC4-related helicase
MHGQKEQTLPLFPNMIRREKGVQSTTTGSAQENIKQASQPAPSMKIHRDTPELFKSPTRITRIAAEKSERFMTIEAHLQRLASTNFNTFKILTTSSKNIRPYFANSSIQYKNYKSFNEIPYGEFLSMGANVKNLTDALDKGKIHGEIAEREVARVLKNFQTLKYLRTPVHLFETQGYGPMVEYVRALKTKDVGSNIRELFDDLKPAGRVIKEALDAREEHPKVNELIKFISERPQSKVIIFAPYRSTVKMLEQKLSENGTRTSVLLDQKDGMSTLERNEILNNFSAADSGVLISTSKAQAFLSKLHVPIAIFYGPLPTKIYGGKDKAGSPQEVVILSTKYSGASDRTARFSFDSEQTGNISVMDFLRAIDSQKQNGPQTSNIPS